MFQSFRRPSGGLSNTIKALIIPRNVRKNVTFSGEIQVTGTCGTIALFSDSSSNVTFGGWYNNTSASVTYTVPYKCKVLVCSHHVNSARNSNLSDGAARILRNGAAVKSQSLVGTGVLTSFSEYVEVAAGDTITANTYMNTNREGGDIVASSVAMTVFTLSQ